MRFIRSLRGGERCELLFFFSFKFNGLIDGTLCDLNKDHARIYLCGIILILMCKYCNVFYKCYSSRTNLNNSSNHGALLARYIRLLSFFLFFFLFSVSGTIFRDYC